MKKITSYLLVLSLLTLTIIQGQTKTVAQWKAELDNDLNGNGGIWLAAAKKSTSAFDGYFEGYEMLSGLVKAWQASGDFRYLDHALAEATNSVNRSFQLDSLYNALDNTNPNTCCDGWLRFPYRGLVHLPNYWDGAKSSNNGNINEYATNGTVLQAYNRVDNQTNEQNRRWKHEALLDNIYWRYVADMLRIMNHNPQIMSLSSNNGQTYQQRFNKILAYVEKNVWEKWFEYPLYGGTGKAKADFVYRVNTHMSTHLGSVAVSLYSITGEQKYYDFIQELLWDFGSNPDSPARVLDGIGLQERIIIESDGDYLIDPNWSKPPGSGYIQDGAHILAEYHFWSQCYEEGLGLNPPYGELPVDLAFLENHVNSIFNNMIIGWTPGNQVHPSQNTDGSGNSSDGNMAGAYFAYSLGFISPLLLDYWEDNGTGNSKKEIGRKGHAMYSAAYQGIGGANVIYPSTVGLSNCPIVSSTAGNSMSLIIGDGYVEQGGTWTDVEDGSGAASVSGDKVNTAVAGVYTVIYSYTDADNCTRQTSLVITVEEGITANDCPVVNSTAGSSLILNIGDTYNELGGTWTDTEDGNGAATLSGDAVDTSTAGIYVVTYSYTDSNDCTQSTDLTVTIISLETTKRINVGGGSFIYNGISWDADDHYNSGNSASSTSADILKTNNDQLYQSERWSYDPKMIYEIPIVNGSYDLNLHFAEIFFNVLEVGGIGSRLFHLDIEGQQIIINNFDIFSRAEGSLTAYIETFRGITVADSFLTIIFTAVENKNSPSLSGIEILPVGTASILPFADAGPDQQIILPTNSANLLGGGIDFNGGTLTYQWSQVNGPNNATLIGENTSELFATDLLEGEYTFRLTVSDINNNTAYDDVVVNIFSEAPIGNIIVQSFAWDVNNLSVQLGDVFNIGYTVLPDNATDKFISFNSSDTNVITVDQFGTITVVGIGTAILTGITTDGSNLSDVINITVSDDAIYVESLIWDNDFVTLPIGKHNLPSYTILPENATDKTVWVQTSDPSIARIDNQNGIINVFKPGTITVKATALDGTFTVGSFTLEAIEGTNESNVPEFSITDNIAGVEGKMLEFLVSLNKPSSEEIVFDVSIEDQTTNANDYILLDEQLVFAPNEIEKTIRVQTLINDEAGEVEESFTLIVNHKQPVNWNKSTMRATGTIFEPLPDFKIYPNPSTSSYMTNLVSALPGTYSVTIYDLSGRIMKNETIEIIDTETQFLLPQLTPNVYIVRLFNLENIYVRKIIVN